MKITGLKLGGIGRFHDDVEVPIAELGDARLVVVVGNNGEGKSTLLEAIPGALYRTTPSRGPIAAMANRRDSFVELRLDLAGQPYTARLLVNGTARNTPTEAYLVNGTGAPLNDGKARTFDAEVIRRFPSADVYLASAFAAQKGDGAFLSLPPAARKELFARLLGLGRLQEMADTAGEKHREAQLRLVEQRAAIEAVRGQAGRVDELRTAHAAAVDAAAKATAAREQAERDRESSRTALDAWRDIAAGLDRDVMQADAAVREASAAAQNAKRELERERKQLAMASAEIARLTEQLGARDSLLTDAAGDCVTPLLEQLEARLAELRVARDASAAAIADWRRRKDSAEGVVRHARRDRQQAENTSSKLSGVPCGGDGPYASCSLIAVATDARANLERFRAAEEAAEAALAGVGDQPAAFDDSAIVGLEKERRLMLESQARAAKAKAKLEALADVERRLASLETEAAGARAAIETAANTETAALTGLDAAQAAQSAAQSRRAEHYRAKPREIDAGIVGGLAVREREAAAAVTRTEGALAAAEKAEAEVTRLTALADAAATEVDDWHALQDALGKNGVQALEIDAAGPEVSTIANELLHACYGSRFSVSLETTSLKADGKGTKEVFDLRVIDTERGTEGSADQLSGGERVLISEALALAIAVYNSRRSSVPMLDLFRDESAGALSHDNAPRYVAMLRRALDVGGFHRVYFVAHQPHLWALADARLVVTDGKVVVE